jgi:L-ornithine N5-oxygenase
LKLGVPEEKRRQQDINVEEDLEVDYVFTATGYLRNAHEDMLSEVRSLLPSDLVKEGKFPVSRDYRVQYDEEKVDARAGVWLQGCNEGTHGVTLNSFMKHFDSS